MFKLLFRRAIGTASTAPQGGQKKGNPMASLQQRVLQIRKVSRTNSGGKIRSISAMVIIGDCNGCGGYGMGRGKDSVTAVEKATAKAFSSMKLYPRLDNRTIYSDMDFKYHSVNLRLRTARPGYGIIASNTIHEVMKVVGISDVYCKIRGSTNPMNVIKATFAALDSQTKPVEIAKMRGKKVFDIEEAYYGIRNKSASL